MNQYSAAETAEQVIARFRAHIVASNEKGCLLWNTKARYGDFQLDKRPVRSHRAAYLLLVGEIPVGLQVLHKCDVKSCVNPEDLYVGTAKDNTRDALERGQYPTGDRNGSRLHPDSVPRGDDSHVAKLTTQSVLRLRALAATGVQQKELALMFGLCRNQVANIIQRRSWAHV